MREIEILIGSVTISMLSWSLLMVGNPLLPKDPSFGTRQNGTLLVKKMKWISLAACVGANVATDKSNIVF